MKKYLLSCIILNWLCLAFYIPIVHADASLEARIDIVLQALQKNKSDLWKLGGKIDTHLKKKVTNVADRQLIGLFKILGRHQQLNEDLAKVDLKKEEAYQKWRKESLGYPNSRSDWRRLGLERRTNLDIGEEKSKIWSQYIDDQGHYRHRVLTGKDGVLKGLQAQQDSLIAERKRLTKLLRELQLELAKDLAVPIDFYILGNLTRWVSAGSTETVELSIRKGKPPFNLQYRNSKGKLVDVKINSTGIHRINFSFDKAADAGLVVFKLEDSALPRNHKSESIAFNFSGDDKKEKETKPPLPGKKETKKDEKKPPVYDEIIARKKCAELDKNSKEWKEHCDVPDNEIPEVLADFSVEFTCGDSFELSPNDVLYPETCYVRVHNAYVEHEKVELKVEYDKELLDVTFDHQTESPKSPYNEFLLIIRTRIPVPETLTIMTIIVKHAGERVKIPVTISILPPGLDASSGSGIRPPAVVEAGSGGPYCVWRYKSFGDPPECFNILTAECDSTKYAGKPKYELVGSGMTWGEAQLRAYVLSPYKGNLYGCNHFGSDEDSGMQDSDNDSIPDATDNCPAVANKNQLDTDKDKIGDVCDTDYDNDLILDFQDNCPTVKNYEQEDIDGDGKGDACDNNSDSDSFVDIEDNCPLLSNPSQDDLDKDGIGDACDTDKDGDGIENATDNCEIIKNSDQLDKDSDGIGNVCDTDIDNDGKLNVEDNCPDDYNPDQKNSDEHWMGDACLAPSSSGDVSTADCSAYPGTKAVWSEETLSAGCVCEGDTDWSDTLKRCASEREDALANANCSAYGKAKAVWDGATGKAMCECISGYEFDEHNQCKAALVSAECADYPGTTYVNKQCECPGALEWSDTQKRCISLAGLSSSDVDCTSYPGSAPHFDSEKNSWGCECVGSKKWSSTLKTCAYSEDEAVASTDCSALKGTTAIYDDFIGGVVCKCIDSGLTISTSKGSCMSSEAAAVADHDCSSMGLGGEAYLDISTGLAACKCKDGFSPNSADTACESNTTVAGPDESDGGDLTDVETEEEGTGHVSSRNVAICVTDSNSILDDHFSLLVNGTAIGSITNPEGGSTCHNATLKGGANVIELRLIRKMGKNTALTMDINDGEYSRGFSGSSNHVWTITAPE